MCKVSHQILLIALESIDNVGDEILRATTEFILRSSFADDIDIQVAQLKPTRKNITWKYKVYWNISAVIRKISWHLGLEKFYKLRNLSYIIAYRKYYEDLIKATDFIILPVGMLKYSTQDFGYLFHLINKLATKYGKPVLMSAMSPQRADHKDWRYHQLVEAVNMPSVKMITTRDGQQGVDIIRNDYLKREIFCDYVGDPALWIPECYHIEQKRNRNIAKIPYVGINIIREGIFDDYNKSITGKEMFQLYVQLIKLVDAKGWKWSVFTNGMASDWQVLKKLQQTIGFSDEHIIEQYTSAKDYVEKVSHFDVVFGARLHACITSVAIGVPVVGFVWENKLKFFSETMGISQFFFNPKEMTAEKIVKKLEEVLLFDLDLVNRDNYKQKTLESIKKFVALS